MNTGIAPQPLGLSSSLSVQKQYSKANSLIQILYLSVKAFLQIFVLHQQRKVRMDMTVEFLRLFGLTFGGICLRSGHFDLMTRELCMGQTQEGFCQPRHYLKLFLVQFDVGQANDSLRWNQYKYYSHHLPPIKPNLSLYFDPITSLHDFIINDNSEKLRPFSLVTCCACVQMFESVQTVDQVLQERMRFFRNDLIQQQRNRSHCCQLSFFIYFL